MNLTLISAAVAAALGFGAAWTIQGRTIDRNQLEVRDERIAQQRAARQVAERLAGQVLQAQSDAAARNVGLRSDAAAASNAAGGLRNTSAATVRTAAADTATCSRIVATYDQLLTDGSRLLQEIARDADQCISERQTLVAAWPK